MIASRDTQRSRMYDWVGNIKAAQPATDKNWTFEQCVALMTEIANDYHIPIPQFKDQPTGESLVHFNPAEYSMNVNKTMRNRHSVLHEMAYAIICKHPKISRLPIAWHGEEFVRVLITLLARYGPSGHTVSEYVKSAKAAKVKVATEALCAPPSQAFFDSLAHINSALATEQEIIRMAKERISLLQAEKIQLFKT